MAVKWPVALHRALGEIWLFIFFSLVFQGTNALYRWFASPTALAKLLLLKLAQICQNSAKVPVFGRVYSHPCAI